MKRLLTIALMMLTCIVASAQDKSWYIINNTNVDELLGQKPHKTHSYIEASQGTFYVNGWDEFYFAIYSMKGNFDVWRTSDGIYYVSAIVGLYSLDGKLEDKVAVKLVSSHLNFTTAYLREGWGYQYSDKKKIKKMIQALKEGTGKVRIVVSKKDRTSFDITVPPYVESEAIPAN